MRAVDAYGLENDTDRKIEVWARCDGILRDPTTGQQVHGAERQHEPMKSSVTIVKNVGWSLQRLTDIIARTAFFAPSEVSEGREFAQTLDMNGVRNAH